MLADRRGAVGQLRAPVSVALAPDPKRAHIDEGDARVSVIAGSRGGQEIIELLEKHRVIEIRFPGGPGFIDTFAAAKTMALRAGFSDPFGSGVGERTFRRRKA